MKNLVLALALFAAAPAAARPICQRPLHPVRTAELFFGQEVGGKLLDAARWQSFVDIEMTPRFPDGLTVYDAYGQWRRADGLLAREPTKVVQIILAGRPDESERLEALIGAYKTQFHQLSVLLVEHRDCAAF